MIDLQAHSTVSDGQLEPADVARAAAEAGVTVMSLTDHDGVAGVAEAIAAAAEPASRTCPPSRCPACTSTPRTSTSAATGSTSTKIAARLRPRPAGARRPRQGDHRATSTRTASRSPSRTRSPRPAPPTAIGRPHIAKAAGAGPDLGPFFEEYLVPGAKAFVVAQLAERRAGRRADPRRPAASPSSPIPTGTSRSPSRSATWSRASSATSASTGSRPSTRPTPKEQTAALPRALRGVRPRPDRLLGLPRPDAQDVLALGAPTTPTGSASRRCPQA